MFADYPKYSAKCPSNTKETNHDASLTSLDIYPGPATGKAQSIGGGQVYVTAGQQGPNEQSRPTN